MLFTITIILLSSLLSWNWGGSSPQFHLKESKDTLEKHIATIHLIDKGKNILEIEGTFYNGGNNEINFYYKLTVTKSGQSNSTSSQSGSFIVKSNKQVVLSTVIVNLNNDDLYTIKLRVFKNNQLIAEDSAIFYGDEISQN
jgi:hypothetical protein